MNKFVGLRLCASVFALVCAASASAQMADNGTSGEEAAASGETEIVVTGRAGAGDRTKADTSYAITTMSEEFLRSRAPTSVTEALKSVPGFWVEASGGEGSGNIRARGIPVDGFGSVNLLENGLPVQHDPALGYLNVDQTFRIDETIDRVEVVRGGPSSIFTPNAPGGVINFITRRAGESIEGIAKYTFGPTANQHRVDGWIGAPIGDWKLGLGGFYRVEDGVRDPGFRGNKGGQFRVDLGRDFSGGKIDLSYRRLDDRTILYTGLPLTRDADGEIVGVPGIDVMHDTLASPATAQLALRNGTGGIVNFDNRDGTRVKLDQFSASAEYELAEGWLLQNKARYRESQTVRNGVYPAALTRATDYVSARRSTLLTAYPGATQVQLRYASDGRAFDLAGQNGNGLIVENSVRPVSIDERELLNDLRLSHSFEIGGMKHDFAVGGYYAYIKDSFRRYSATVLEDVSGNAQLLDLVALDASGRVVGSQTQNGVSRYGSEFANGTGTSDTFAVYASDEWQVTDQLRIDGGLRYEKVKTEGRSEGSRSVNLGDPSTLADNNVLTGSGVTKSFDRKFDQFGWTIGANWQFSPRAGVFARYTAAFRLPGVGNFITDPTARPVTQKVKLSEAGVKYSGRWLSLYATAFNTDYDSFAISNNVFNSATGGYEVRTEYADTRAYGVELEAIVRPVSWFDLALNGTAQKPEFRDLRFTQLVSGKPVDVDYSGNRLLRVPEVSFRVTPGVNLLDNRLRAQMDVEYYGKRFGDAANTQKLPAYTVLNASLRFAVTPEISLFAYGDNLTNKLGLTEGNPRSGELSSGQAGNQLFIGRPILGRSFRFAASYRF
ncbi:cyclic nucleotide-binding protein [Sphingomonas oleivorans]|uniref:Cyclic nucleotide-binding protein n=1 Tax=Sphingomonas oleivorans TaxID=1735121 RepID=A0A2T5G130_9SPHN|nr:TonB-dependent receptor [Sphingomonas oleivorans]PTQ12865.1 cyclic nucleotide-binding protein [Sphingomonas oleivorans]